MKKRLIRIAAGLIVLAMLLPAYSEADDGGTKEYSALLYSVVRRRTMTDQEDTFGYITGIEIRVLGFEAYSSVRFIPSDRK